MTSKNKVLGWLSDDEGHLGGFSLLELLVVLTIIGLLIAIAVPRVREVIPYGRNTAIKAELAGVPAEANIYRGLEGDGAFEDFCASPGWLRIRNTIKDEHRVAGDRINCIDSSHFFIVSSGLHGVDYYWVVNSVGRSDAGESVKGLLHYWRFQEGRGTIARDSAGKSDGSLRGITLPIWRFEALRFNGHNFVEALNITLPAASISAWVRRDGGDWQFISRTGGVYWIDGVRVTPSPAISPLPVRIVGTTVRIGENFTGFIDDVRIYNRALISAGGIRAEYEAGEWRKGAILSLLLR